MKSLKDIGMKSRINKILILFAFCMLAGCSTNKSGGSESQEFGKGVVQPANAIITRGARSLESKPRQTNIAVTRNFDFKLASEETELDGEQDLTVTLISQVPGLLTFTDEKQLSYNLYYRLASDEQSLKLNSGGSFHLMQNNLMVRGSFCKMLVLTEGKKLQLAFLSGGSIEPYSNELEGGISIQQSKDLGEETRKGKVFTYNTVDISVSLGGTRMTLTPGEEKPLGQSGLKVGVLESSKRSLIDPEDAVAKAFAEGPDYNYKIAIYK